MKIDSGLNGYYYPNRTLDMDRKTEEAPQRETVSVQRSPNALTGSSTLLSSSLANALWVIESGETASTEAEAPMPTVPHDWVEGVYQEFA
ncbi:hypothetical protein J2046_002113 [Rhizobium petrolearium]|uniref:Uncharacterized protein n=1 Tax=Neorhizobium phenanthreniclasticum TaxID=3157917 RepID=A0ABV0M7C4_9HYPH|nr:hypothetical protein [Neorhizobium petrolearium]MBP1843857.1 hypothetical protein [Neorhizobium petrolearium]